MRFSSIDSIVPSALPAALPLRLEQNTSSVSTLLKLAVVLPATLALLLPFLLLVQAFAADPAVRTALMERPATLIQLMLGLAFWGVLFAWPLKRLTDGLARHRSITIADGLVTITEASLLATRSWSTPLAGYAGVIHHVRASLSGLRHELILAHADRNSSVLLTISPSIAQGEIDRVSTLLGLREVPSAAIYALRPGRAPRTPAVAGAPYARAA